MLAAMEAASEEAAKHRMVVTALHRQTQHAAMEAASEEAAKELGYQSHAKPHHHRRNGGRLRRGGEGDLDMVKLIDEAAAAMEAASEEAAK